LPRTGGGARFVLTLPVAVGDADLEEDAVADVAARNGDHGVRPAS
jgi:hypothetical protein